MLSGIPAYNVARGPTKSVVTHITPRNIYHSHRAVCPTTISHTSPHGLVPSPIKALESDRQHRLAKYSGQAEV